MPKLKKLRKLVWDELEWKCENDLKAWCKFHNYKFIDLTKIKKNIK